MALRIFLFSLFLLFPCSQLHAAYSPIKIVYYSGNPEINTGKDTGGLPALAGLLAAMRSGKEQVVFLHGGRAIAPSTLASFDRGTHMIDLLNRLEPVAFSVGKSDFAFREDELTLRSREASFPFLSANLFDPLTNGPPEGIRSHLIYRAGEYTIAIFTITNPELMQDYLLDRVSIVPLERSIEETSEQLKEIGADLIIMMTDYLLPPTLLTQISTKGVIDLIFTSERESSSTKGGDTFQYIHNRTDKALIIELQPTAGAGDIDWQVQYNTSELANVPQDPAMQEAVSGYLSQLTRFLEVEIGITETELDTRKSSVRTGENAFGNLVADAIRDAFKADIGLMNGGGIRGNKLYQPGTVLTRGDMLREIPFRNHAVKLQVTGQQLLDALENGFSRIEEVKGCFPHVSGIQVTYNPDAEPFNRVHKVSIHGKPLIAGKSYSLATVNFLAAGGDGFSSLKKGEQLDRFGSTKLLWEYVKEYVAEKKRIAPVKEQRLIDITN